MQYIAAALEKSAAENEEAMDRGLASLAKVSISYIYYKKNLAPTSHRTPCGIQNTKLNDLSNQRP
jgi:hypothetical protein